jgi:uncharacterized protein YciI
LFAVTIRRGKSWDKNKPMSQQEEWKEHAEFMNNLAENDFIILGGPFKTSEDVLLIVRADNEEDIRNILAEDIWHKLNILEIADIQEWKILIQKGYSG